MEQTSLREGAEVVSRSLQLSLLFARRRCRQRLYGGRLPIGLFGLFATVLSSFVL